MTFLGSILGYDQLGGDLFGVNRDESQNCIVCGFSVYHHSEERQKECLLKYSQDLRRQRLGGNMTCQQCSAHAQLFAFLDCKIIYACTKHYGGMRKDQSTGWFRLGRVKRVGDK